LIAAKIAVESVARLPVAADTELDSTATLLVLVDSPVVSAFTPACAVLMPVDAEVDSVATPEFVVERPVDNDAAAVDAVVDSVLN
jgi:hypothetical protein